MEIRTVTQIKIYVLYMNPISGNCESTVPVAASAELERLMNWYNSQTCEMYRDNLMNKFFKKGSDLEFFNPISTFNVNWDLKFHHGIFTAWINTDNTGLRPANLHSGIKWIE